MYPVYNSHHLEPNQIFDQISSFELIPPFPIISKKKKSKAIKAHKGYCPMKKTTDYPVFKPIHSQKIEKRTPEPASLKLFEFPPDMKEYAV